MFLSFLKNLAYRAPERNGKAHTPINGPLRLHIGGQNPHPDWKIFDVRPGPGVDFVGHCTDLSEFFDGSVSEIYASHVIEHLGFKRELPTALREFNRVLVPGGILRVSVPDLPTLCALYLDPAFEAEDRYQVVRMIFGGQLHAADFHHCGFNEEFLASHLQKSGFVDIVRVNDFGLFDDNSTHIFKGRPVSLNMHARKPHGD